VNKVRIGMLTPSSNTALEPLTYLIFRKVPGLSVHFSRLSVVNASLDSEDQFRTESFLAAARLLADAPVDVIAWNGTSGSWLGPERDRELCRAIEDEFGIRTTTSTLALLDAFRVLNVTRYGLAVPYKRDHTEKIVETLRNVGLECVKADWMNLAGNAEIDLVSQDAFRDQIRSVAKQGAQAVAIICTGVPAAPVVDELEAELSMPILDSIVVTAWKCLTLLNFPVSISGWGQLLRAYVSQDRDVC